MPPSILSRDFARDIRALSPPPTSTTATAQLARRLHDFTRTLLPRLATDVSTVPEGYGRAPNGPDAGTVVGIVLGSIAGFIVLLWLIYWCVNLGSPPTAAAVGDVEDGSAVGGPSSSSVMSFRPPRAHRSSRRHSHRSHSGPHRTKETIEITRRDRSAAPPQPGPEQIVVMEEHSNLSRSRSRSRSRSMGPPPPRRVTPPPPRPPPDDDEIIVLEEHTPPRRRDSRSYRRSSERRSSGYRDDPRRRSGSRR
ncbi:hypothetical protein GGR54DRAFT_595743 [Hypoxylon sp. NC1633]|nr:hypothetical protein GGR54DRAFT_595743 [Hypoxylon sp. NC1633]